MLMCRVLLSVSLFSLMTTLCVQEAASALKQDSSVPSPETSVQPNPMVVKKNTRNAKLTQKKKKVSIQKKKILKSDLSNLSSAKKNPDTLLLNKNVTNTPQWLRIDHTRFTRALNKMPINDTHPFKRALVSAYTTNGAIRSELRKYYATAEEISKALSGWRPDVTGNLSGGVAMTEGYDYTGKKVRSTVHPASAGVTVTQPLFQGGGTLSATAAAENRLRAARASFLNTEQITLLNAIQAYLKLWAARENLKITTDSEKFYKESLAQARAQLDVGDKSKTDLDTALFNFQTSEAKLRAAKADLIIAESGYIQNIGETAPDILPLPASAEEMMEIPPNLPLFLENTNRYNPGVIGAEYLHLASRNDIDSANANLLPSVNLVGSADRQTDKTQAGYRQNDASLMVQVTLPFYTSGGLNWALSRQNIQTAAQTKYDIKTARDLAQFQAKQAWETFLSNKTQTKELKLAIDAGNQSVEGTRQEYLVGEITLIEVFQVKNNVDSALASLVQAQLDYVYSSYNMLSIIGELTPETMRLAVGTYDLDTYPETIRNKWIGWTNVPTGPLRN